MAAVPANRLIGRDLATWTVGTITDSTILERYQNGSLDIRIERVDTTTVKDQGRTSRAAHYSWRVMANTVVETSMALLGEALGQGMADVAMTLVTAGDVAGNRFDGTIGWTGFSTRFDEAPQTEGTEFDGIGTLTVDLTALTFDDLSGE